MDAERLVCPRDGAPTRLRCAQCDAPVCPRCLVRTPVGHKCPACAGAVRPAPAARRVGLAVGAGVGALVLLAGLGLLTRSSGGGGSDPVALEAPAGEVAVTTQAMLGEEARDGQLTFVVDEVSCAAPQAPAGAGRLCTLRFSVKNASSAPAMFLGRFQYLVDAQSKTYGADEALTRALPGNVRSDVFEINVNPEVVVPLAFVFELPENVEPTEAQFKGNGRSRIGVNVRLQRRSS